MLPRPFIDAPSMRGISTIEFHGSTALWFADSERLERMYGFTKPARRYVSLLRGRGLETQDDDLGAHRLRRPRHHRKAGGHGNSLCAICRVGDYSAADPAAAAEHLAPQFLPGGGIQRIEVATQITEEHDATRRRRDGADDGVVGLHAPLPDPRVGVGGVHPSSPISVGFGFL